MHRISCQNTHCAKRIGSDQQESITPGAILEIGIVKPIGYRKFYIAMELTKNELDLALRSTQVFSTEYYHGVLYDYHATVTLYHERVLNEVHRPEYTARLEQVLATACTAEVASEPARTGKLLANRLATLLHPVDTGQISTHRVYAMSTGIQELDAWSLQSESRDGIHLDTLLAAVIRMYFDRARHYLVSAAKG